MVEKSALLGWRIMFQELQLLRELPPEALPQERPTNFGSDRNIDDDYVESDLSGGKLSARTVRDWKGAPDHAKGKLSGQTIRAWEESLALQERRYVPPVSVADLFAAWPRVPWIKRFTSVSV
jgi:hypothetical protein